MFVGTLWELQLGVPALGLVQLARVLACTVNPKPSTLNSKP